MVHVLKRVEEKKIKILGIRSSYFLYVWPLTLDRKSDYYYKMSENGNREEREIG